jgi:hypothetical protein
VQILIDSFDRQEEAEKLLVEAGVTFLRHPVVDNVLDLMANVDLVPGILNRAKIEWQWTAEVEDDEVDREYGRPYQEDDERYL